MSTHLEGSLYVHNFFLASAFKSNEHTQNTFNLLIYMTLIVCQIEVGPLNNPCSHKQSHSFEQT